MISIIRARDGAIKTYSERPHSGYNLALDESVEQMDVEFNTYAQRFTLSCGGRSGETLSVAQGSGDLLVELSCPGESTVDVDINGLVDTLAVVNGKAQLTLSTDVPGVFLLQPADRKRYCAAGEAVLCIEVNPNG